MLTCPECECERNPKDTRCRVCGADFEYADKLHEEKERRKQARKDRPGKDAGQPAPPPRTKRPDIHVSFTECPRCGFDRAPEHLTCPMCNADYVFLAHLEAEKKARKRQGAAPSANGAEPAAPVVSASRAAGIVMGKCPACGAPRMSTYTNCPRCGEVFRKGASVAIDNREASDEAGSSGDKGVLASIEDYEAELRKLEAGDAESRDSKPETEGMGRGAAERIRDSGRIFGNIGRAAAADSARLFAGFRELLSRAATGLRERVVDAFARVSWTRLAVVASTLVAVGAVVYFLPGYLAELREQDARSRARELEGLSTTVLREVDRRLAEHHERMVRKYDVNRTDIHQRLRNHVDNREFDLFDQAIKPYDIPPLQPDLAVIKRHAEEMKLYETAMQYPSEALREKYDAFQRLIDLNPGNTDYRRLREQYARMIADELHDRARKKFRENRGDRSRLQAALALLKEAVALNPDDRKIASLRRAIQTELLTFYEGNDHLVLAVRDDGINGRFHKGQRRIYIWIKNAGDRPFFPSLDSFRLVGVDGRHYKYNDSDRSLAISIAPGKEIGGYLYFYTTVTPRSLVFDHQSLGKIVREFPD